MSEVTGFAEERWVRIMPDFGADGVWHRDGCSGDADHLPVPKHLVARIRAWQEWYERDAPTPGDPPPHFDIVAFSAEGLGIARAVKAALPDFTVIYFDEAALKPDAEQPREEFEYEIT